MLIGTIERLYKSNHISEDCTSFKVLFFDRLIDFFCKDGKNRTSFSLETVFNNLDDSCIFCAVFFVWFFLFPSLTFCLFYKVLFFRIIEYCYNIPPFIESKKIIWMERSHCELTCVHSMKFKHFSKISQEFSELFGVVSGSNIGASIGCSFPDNTEGREASWWYF